MLRRDGGKGIRFILPAIRVEKEAWMEERSLGMNIDGQTAGRETELEMALESRTSINEVGLHQQGMTPGTKQEQGAGQPDEQDDAVARQRIGIRE